MKGNMLSFRDKAERELQTETDNGTCKLKGIKCSGCGKIYQYVRKKRKRYNKVKPYVER